MRNILKLAVKECGINERYIDTMKRIKAKGRTKAREYLGDENEVDKDEVLDNYWELDEFQKFISVVDDPKYKL